MMVRFSYFMKIKEKMQKKKQKTNERRSIGGEEDFVNIFTNVIENRKCESDHSVFLNI